MEKGADLTTQLGQPVRRFVAIRKTKVSALTLKNKARTQAVKEALKPKLIRKRARL